MILTTTYRDRTTAARDLLAAFSPLDHATTAGLARAELDGALARLLRRLAVLAALHGADVPAAMLAALAEPAGRDIVDVASAWLEHGDGRQLDAGAGELQQELVHFSRIVDIGALGLTAGAAELAVRRLRGSERLPEPLQVLSELTIVTRSRLAQRGQVLALPRLRPEPPAETDVAGDLTVAAPPAAADYWMAIGCARRRTRRQFRYELAALLDYLTPAEAALALWAHCHEQQLPLPVQAAVAQADAIGGITIVTWSYKPDQKPEAGDVPGLVAGQLPAVTRLAPGGAACIRVGEAAYAVTATSPAAAIVEEAASGKRAAALAAPGADAVAVADMVRRALDLMEAYTGPELVSVEAGHVHLDRDLDVDQEAGAAIGAAALRLLGGRQQRAPALTPMMDDDHVLVRLAPAAYRRFLDGRIGPQPMHLICESSPVIRSIVVALFDRLTRSRHASRIQARGGNLFLGLPDGSHCEVFEAFAGGAPVTGCAFFETALLTYRCDPAGFDAYFTRRYGLAEGVHEHAAALLSRGLPHDEAAAALAAYYRAFADVTDPRRPDPDITALVDAVLEQAAPVTGHLNILEDYYEVQQRRVRELLRLLGLPFQLVTVHFNTATGRVVLCDD